MIWPWAPMLNSPARKATATPRPARTSGTLNTSDSVSGRTWRSKVVASGLNTAPLNSEV